jgi:hypothetical protein
MADSSAFINLPGYAGAFVIGAIVAAIELITRYKDDIRRAVGSAPALFYALLNGAAALGAAWAIVHWFPTTLSIAGRESSFNQPALAMAAGFGAMAVLRAGIMKIRVGQGQDVSVGPGLIIERLLAVIDRLVDRRMASYRGGVADSLVQQINFSTHATALVTECLTRLSNISAEEGQQLTTFANALTGRTDISDRQKSRALLMQLLAVVGEKVLKESVQSVI